MHISNRQCTPPDKTRSSSPLTSHRRGRPNQLVRSCLRWYNETTRLRSTTGFTPSPPRSRSVPHLLHALHLPLATSMMLLREASVGGRNSTQSQPEMKGLKYLGTKLQGTKYGRSIVRISIGWKLVLTGYVSCSSFRTYMHDAMENQNKMLIGVVWQGQFRDITLPGRRVR